MKRVICLVCCFLLAGVPAISAHGQSLFAKAMKKKYDFRTVSCYTCHAKKSEVPADQQEAYKENRKAFRNEFGQHFAELLKGKDITRRLEEVKDLDSDDPNKEQLKEKVEEEVTKEFLEVLPEVEKIESPDGPTYGELLKEGTLDGVRLKK